MIKNDVGRNEGSVSLDQLKPSQAIRHIEALRWTEAAITAGLDPWLVQNSLQEEDAGEWRIATKLRDDASEPVPVDYFDEIVLILVSMDRVRPDPALKCWDGEVLLDDCSARAIALRLRLMRRCQHLAGAGSFGDWYVSPGFAGREADALDVESPLMIAAIDISRSHGIPEEWLLFGMSSEIGLSQQGR